MKNVVQNLCLFSLFIALFFACKKDKNKNIVTDIDGNVYHTVQIGTQTWMVENLKVSQLNDGTQLTLSTDDVAWGSNKQIGSFRWYADDITNKAPYGAFYNLAAVQSGKLAPKGWHIPTDQEWETLATTLGGASIAGGKMKEQGNVHWGGANIGATNESGFTAVATGICTNSGFSFSSGIAAFYTATQQQAGTISLYQLNSGTTELLKNGFSDEVGLAVRCVKDNL